MRITIQGKPVPKQSFRYSQKGSYSTKRVTDYAKLIKHSFLRKYKKSDKLLGPVKFTLTIYRKVPIADSKRVKAQKLFNRILPTVTPDLDNCMKNIFDALNGLAYLDDKQITTIYAKRLFAETNYVEIIIEEDNESAQ